MFKLGLTGSIGMGKSTTANMFADEGCAVWDADAAVHRLYSMNGAAVALFQQQLPAAVEENAVSRPRLKAMIDDDPSILKTIEQIVHPLVHQDRLDFIEATDAAIAVFDIPLLFENGSEDQFDATACVYVEPDIQYARVLTRGTMSDAQFKTILSKQMPISEKLAKADHRIHTDTIDHAHAQVREIVSQIKRVIADA